MEPIPSGLSSWERCLRAAEQVQERLGRSTAALNATGVPYAVIGDNAVRAWVERVDESAVRATPIVELLLRRRDLPAAEAALLQAGFLHATPQPASLRHGHIVLIDGPDGRSREGLFVAFSGERLIASDAYALPDVSESEQFEKFGVVNLAALVRMEVTTFKNLNRLSDCTTCWTWA